MGPRHESLHHLPKHLRFFDEQKSETVIEYWNRSIPPESKMRHLSVDELMKHVDNVEIVDSTWRQYINERYGV